MQRSDSLHSVQDGSLLSYSCQYLMPSSQVARMLQGPPHRTPKSVSYPLALPPQCSRWVHSCFAGVGDDRVYIDVLGASLMGMELCNQMGMADFTGITTREPALQRCSKMAITNSSHPLVNIHSARATSTPAAALVRKAAVLLLNGRLN